MKSRFSIAWKGSRQPRKQRKRRANAPLHVRGSFLNAPLIKDLRAKHGARTLRVRVGDKVRVQRGQFKGRTGSVERVNPKEMKVFIFV